ncbi:MAG: hypothetical protein E4H01_05230, partial [Lysobacterales bacterium]
MKKKPKGQLARRKSVPPTTDSTNLDPEIETVQVVPFGLVGAPTKLQRVMRDARIPDGWVTAEDIMSIAIADADRRTPRLPEDPSVTPTARPPTSGRTTVDILGAITRAKKPIGIQFFNPDSGAMLPKAQASEWIASNRVRATLMSGLWQNSHDDPVYVLLLNENDLRREYQAASEKEKKQAHDDCIEAFTEEVLQSPPRLSRTGYAEYYNREFGISKHAFHESISGEALRHAKKRGAPRERLDAYKKTGPRKHADGTPVGRDALSAIRAASPLCQRERDRWLCEISVEGGRMIRGHGRARNGGEDGG